MIRDHAGQVVREVSITPVPLDRPPFPLPPGVQVSIYFTIQPGGAYLYGAAGARLIYPNHADEPPGTRFKFWNYDPEERGWYVYGHGTVTATGRRVVPDPGVTIYGFRFRDPTWFWDDIWGRGPSSEGWKRYDGY